jgi:hypothetical protein
MRLVPILALAMTGAALVGCGGTHTSRSYSDHDVVYRAPAYDDRYYYEDNGPPDGALYYQPGYGAVPVERHGTIYDDDDGYYYYRD